MSDISQLGRVAVLSVGDVMLDEYVWGQVRRISPEAPVPVVEVSRYTHTPGGAANVAAGVVALGGRSFLSGVVGEDRAASVLLDALAAAGVAGEDLVADASRPTTSKTRVIAHAQQVVRTDHEARGPLSEAVEDRLLARIRARLGEVDAVVLSDYRKGVVSARLAQSLIEAAARAGKPVIVDPKGLDYARYRGATVITPNEHDAGQSANIHVETEEDLVRAAQRLGEACAGAALLITRGASGMSLFAGEDRFDVPTRARDVYDVTGAGDTVVAVLAAALGSGMDLRRAVELANAAAGIVVGKVGTSTVSLAELEELVQG
ncbi:MAG: D-glycero-beta-D-manno-heptose-7-phosphate kinase [Actinomycetota bacterium]|nr:D-glycero-beta-D-manno-heptose-7-phosphate kinase [Actinomycetota bacterium]